MYLAHKKDDNEYQTLIEHLRGVANLSRSFGEKIELGEISYTLGLLHDIGKYSLKFQKRINGENIRVDHSTAGAIELKKLGIIEELLGMIIAGHHSGLQDYGLETDIDSPTYLRRMNPNCYSIEDYSKFKTEIDMKEVYIEKNEIISKRENTKENYNQETVDGKIIGFSIGTTLKILYSILVDSDFLDTELFYLGEERIKCESLSLLLKKFNTYMESFVKNEITDKNQKIYFYRNEILLNCIKKGKGKKGLFTLNVPTGSGKTLSSMSFALNHGVENNMDRVIYVIPYTSIIEQTAQQFKKILGLENVLEHHCNFFYKENDDKLFEYFDNKYMKASENWDMPVIVTTTVQFFESFFSNKSSKTRKLHNLSNSVIIFDEVQQLPIDYLNPCISALSELITNYKSTVVLCSATCPVLESYFYKKIRESHTIIVENKDEIYKVFNNVRISFIGEIDDNFLIKKIEKEHNALCIVNTRKHAKAIYDKLEGDGVYHLSTLLTPVDRKKSIAEIRERLENCEKCVVISTQLIEAGVDLDFRTVYRSIAGIDSIAQAAGRCNREGKYEFGNVFVFETEGMRIPKGELERNANLGRGILKKYETNALSNEAINEYFQLKYEIKNNENNLDKKGILENFNISSSPILDFSKTAIDFKFIESDMYDIIIQNEETELLIEKIKNKITTNKINRELQQHTVSVYEYEFKKLFNEGAVEIYNKYIILSDEKLYTKNKGLDIFDDRESEALFL